MGVLVRGVPARGADDASVLAAAERVLRRRRYVVTQREFGRLVAEELGTNGPTRPVSGERARRLAASAPFCRLEYHARNGPKEKVLHACPVCAGELMRVKNETLFGGQVTLVLRCRACGYRTGKQKRVPTLYMFHWRGGA